MTDFFDDQPCWCIPHGCLVGGEDSQERRHKLLGVHSVSLKEEIWFPFDLLRVHQRLGWWSLGVCKKVGLGLLDMVSWFCNGWILFMLSGLLDC